MSWDSEFETLSEEECLSLLAGVEYGRVAVVTADGHPEIFPVNFALEGRSVVFSTGSRLLIARAPLGHIAFETDSIDPTTHEGWDVVVSGEGGDITDSIDEGSVTARSHPHRALGTRQEGPLDNDRQPELPRPAPVRPSALPEGRLRPLRSVPR